MNIMGYRIFLLALWAVMFYSCGKMDVKVEVYFTPLETMTDVSIRALYVANESVIWAGGSEGTVLNSVDGGKKWNTFEIPGEEKNDFRSIHAWDKDRALVFGVMGPVFGYKTEDGGKSWTPVYRDTTKGLFFNSLKFANENVGLAVSDPIDGKFFVLRTENGGATWDRITDLPMVEKGEANFAASNTCIEFLPSGKAWIASGGNAARVFFSNDYGESWEVVKTPMVRGNSSSGIFSIAFINDKEGIIVGGTYDSPELNQNIAAYTFDGGKKWLPAESMPREYRSCVQVLSDTEKEFCLAIGKTGFDLSIDGGINWKFKGNNGYYTFRSVPNQLKGYAAGANGEIAKVTFEYR